MDGISTAHSSGPYNPQAHGPGVENVCTCSAKASGDGARMGKCLKIRALVGRSAGYGAAAAVSSFEKITPWMGKNESRVLSSPLRNNGHFAKGGDTVGKRRMGAKESPERAASKKGLHDAQG